MKDEVRFALSTCLPIVTLHVSLYTYFPVADTMGALISGKG